MIYVFEGTDNSASVVYDGRTLNEEQKARAVVVESLPVKNTPEGKVAILKADKSTNQVWYDYEDKPQDDEMINLERKIDNAILELTTLIAMGGM